MYIERPVFRAGSPIPAMVLRPWRKSIGVESGGKGNSFHLSCSGVKVNESDEKWLEKDGWVYDVNGVWLAAVGRSL